MSVRSYTQADIKLLWGRAAARCGRCRALCTADATATDPAVVLGEVAHLVAHADTGPRADTTVLERDRDRYDNLILLCATCHALVDKQPGTYPIGILRELKEQHERWVHERLAAELPEVGFSELEQVTRGLLAAPSSPTEDLTVVAPTEKLAKNNLSAKTRFTLTMGLSKAREVGAYLDRAAAVLDPEFPERLRAGFVGKYKSLVRDGLSGDALYEALREFAAPPRRAFGEQAAGLAVLAYLFEACEVFER